MGGKHFLICSSLVSEPRYGRFTKSIGLQIVRTEGRLPLYIVTCSFDVTFRHIQDVKNVAGVNPASVTSRDPKNLSYQLQRGANPYQVGSAVRDALMEIERDVM